MMNRTGDKGEQKYLKTAGLRCFDKAIFIMLEHTVHRTAQYFDSLCNTRETDNLIILTKRHSSNAKKQVISDGSSPLQMSHYYYTSRT